MKTPEGRKKASQTAREALVGSGFIYIDGADGYDPDTLHELCQWFFG